MSGDLLGSSSLAFGTPDLHFGDGVVKELNSVLEERKIESPLLITDEGIETAGVLERATSSLETDPVIEYATTEPSTDDFHDVPEGEFDGIIAVGGGSVLDTAKVLAILLEHGGEPADYLGGGVLPGPTLPIIAVPTTSGTGSQSTPTAVVAHEGSKPPISYERLRPEVAIVDPSLTYGLPREVTATAGFDAFVHSLESLTARDYRWVPERPVNYQGATAVSKPLSRQALRLIYGSLERAVLDTEDRDARREMSLGSHLAGVAFSNVGLGIVHALASAVGGMTGRPHGQCLAASIETGLTYNLPVRREEYAQLAYDFGIVDAAVPTSEAAISWIDECDRIRASINLPGSFAELGLDKGDIDEIISGTRAQKEHRLKTNPREVTDELRDVINATF